MIESKRLIIRPFKKDDVDDFYEFASDDKIGLNAGWLPHESKKQTLRLIKKYSKRNEIMAICLKENNKVIGKIGLYDDLPVMDYFSLSQKSLGFCISRQYWGNGYALEASRIFIDYVFKNDLVDLLWCCHFVDNHRSESVVKRLNFMFYDEIIYDAIDIGKKAFAKLYYLKKSNYLNEEDL